MEKSISVLAFVAICLFSNSAKAQNPLSQNVQTTFGLGLATSVMHGGEELLASQSIRNNGLSYYQNPTGDRKNVGSYGNPFGWVVTTAYYLPIKKVNGLMLGTSVRASLAGTQPSIGGYEEGYFFNYLTFTAGAKYYPFTNNNLFIKGDFGLASVFTKNRYVNAEGKQNYFHQFGIGTNFSGGLGYSIKPFKNSEKVFDIYAVYQLNNTRVEVNNVGNDVWRFSGLNLIAAINF